MVTNNLLNNSEDFKSVSSNSGNVQNIQKGIPIYFKNNLSEHNERSETGIKPYYSLLLNNKKYKDYSLIGILKLLLNNHKIAKYQYKESIKRIKENRKLRNNVYTKCSYYLKTIKSHSNKSSLLKWDLNHSKQYKQFIILTASNNLSYSVYIKRKVMSTLFTNNYLNSVYKDLLTDKIRIQFLNKLKGDNKISL